MIRRLTDAERELWERVRRSVRPLRWSEAREDGLAGRQEAESSDGGFSPRASRRPGPAAALPDAAVPERASRPAAIEPKLRRRLARGTATLDGRLDLHGLDQEAAIRALEAFLRARQADCDRMVLVITGKGRAEGATSGVLRQQVPRWLSLPRFRNLVAGYGEAGRRHGGSGALYIRLRRSPRWRP